MSRFLREAERNEDRIYLCGVEKSGRFVRHLLAQKMDSPKEGITFAVPGHGYVQVNIDGRPMETDHNYGERNVLGERVFVLLPENRRYVLSIPARSGLRMCMTRCWITIRSTRWRRYLD